MGRNSTPSKQKEKRKRKKKKRKRPNNASNSEEKHIKTEVTVGFQQSTCLRNSFLQGQSQIKWDYFQLQMLHSSHRSNGRLFWGSAFDHALTYSQLHLTELFLYQAITQHHFHFISDEAFPLTNSKTVFHKYKT